MRTAVERVGQQNSTAVRGVVGDNLNVTSPPYVSAEAAISSTTPVAGRSVSLSRFVPRKLLTFPALLIVALAASIFVLDSGSIADPDIWWHLRNAEMLVKSHTLVRQDIYSFTAQSARWVNEAWLSELPFYFGWRWLDVRGLYLVMLLELEAILLGLLRLAYVSSRNLKASFLVTSLAVWLATVSFGPRTLLAGWICLVAELLIFARFRQGCDRTWLLPPLFMIWVNLHGSWFIGMVLLAVFFASGLFKGSWGRLDAVPWTPRQVKKLILVGALSIASLFVNPFGYRLVFYPLNFAFCQRLNVGHVDEWLSLDFHSLRGKILFGMLALSLVLALTRKIRWRLDELAFLIVGFYAAVTYSRFLFLAAILLTPILARELSFVPAYQDAKDRWWLNLVFMAAIFALCLWRFPTDSLLNRDTQRDYPVKALPYLRRFRPEGRVFNDFLWGGFLIWNLRDIPVFIDSRVDIFEYRGVFADYLDAMGGMETLNVMDKYHIKYVLYRHKTPLAYLLMHSGQWQTEYQDETTVLLERIGPVP